jgi:hypothetical protein
MSRIFVAASCGLCFILGTLVSLPRMHAQDSASNRTFYVIDYMKSRPGQDAFKMERDLWKPLHQSRLQNGEITSWAVMVPVLAGPHNYDYITVTGYRSMAAYEQTETAMRTAMEKTWGKENVQGKMTQTDQARDMLGSEMYFLVDGIGKVPK